MGFANDAGGGLYRGRSVYQTTNPQGLVDLTASAVKGACLWMVECGLASWERNSSRQSMPRRCSNVLLRRS